MSVAKHVMIAGKAYPIQYTANALRRLEQQTKMTTTQLGFLLVSGQGGFSHLHDILWAGLEGARLKEMTRLQPYTIDEVGDLLDEAGGPQVFWAEGSENGNLLLEAWQSAFPTKERKELKQAENKDPNDDAAATS